MKKKKLTFKQRFCFAQKNRFDVAAEQLGVVYMFERRLIGVWINENFFLGAMFGKGKAKVYDISLDSRTDV